MPIGAQTPSRFTPAAYAMVQRASMSWTTGASDAPTVRDESAMTLRISRGRRAFKSDGVHEPATAFSASRCQSASKVDADPQLTHTDEGTRTERSPEKHPCGAHPEILLHNAPGVRRPTP